jgi:hypothetical protein
MRPKNRPPGNSGRHGKCRPLDGGGGGGGRQRFLAGKDLAGRQGCREGGRGLKFHLKNVVVTVH